MSFTQHPAHRPKSLTHQAPDPRSLAVRFLLELERGRRTLDALLEEMEETGRLRDGRDRGLFNAILYGVLRWRGRLDYLIAGFSKKPLAKIDPPILNILRVGLFQLIFMTRIPTSAAVNTSVQLAKSMAAPWAGAFVNAILRRAAADHGSVEFPDSQAHPVKSLAASWAFPEWLVERWLERYGAERAAALCESINLIPPVILRTNTLKTSRSDLMAALQPEAEEVAAATTAPDGVRVSGLRRRLTTLNSFQQGWFQVQDEAAQMISLFLDPRPGEAVLDACAGRGGKTGHIAQLMGNQGSLVALDRSGARLSSLQKEMQRLGVSIVSCREKDLADRSIMSQTGFFQRVLLDAPCSGLGTLRRNPDIKWAADRQDLRRYHDTQLSLLERAADLVTSGGVLVYAVCSPEPEETVEVVRRFLEKNTGFQLDRDLRDLPGTVRQMLDSQGFLQTYPHLRYMDGFFAARIKFEA
jgi:16S rRNA (cytosine967-C5)-methyltransferase